MGLDDDWRKERDEVGRGEALVNHILGTLLVAVGVLIMLFVIVAIGFGIIRAWQLGVELISQPPEAGFHLITDRSPE